MKAWKSFSYLDGAFEAFILFLEYFLMEFFSYQWGLRFIDFNFIRKMWIVVIKYVLKYLSQ